MANPTTNFNWQMPTNTDLVKDLPADFEVFGQAVDTSLMDLKGGTTGQILSKASNTDMDFTWIANDQGDITAVNVSSPITGGGTAGAVTVGIQDGTTAQKGAVQLEDSTSSTSTTKAATPNSVKTSYDLANAAIPKSLVDAKGDLVSASADNTPAILTVGNNGETLLADSSTSTGLRWQGNFAAGKNKIINGDFGIWQRGTSFTNLTSGSYCADRWIVTSQDSGMDVARTAFTPGTAPIAGYESNFYASITVNATGTDERFEQRIENVTTFAGQTITVSFWAKSNITTDAIQYVRVRQNFGSGGSANVDTTSSTISLTSSWTRYSVTLAVPSISGKTIGTSSFLVIGLDLKESTAQVLDLWGFQAEAGSVATAFQTATGTLQGELAAAQRYY